VISLSSIGSSGLVALGTTMAKGQLEHSAEDGL
jgi:hypothetical protein